MTTEYLERLASLIVAEKRAWRNARTNEPRAVSLAVKASERVVEFERKAKQNESKSSQALIDTAPELLNTCKNILWLFNEMRRQGETGFEVTILNLESVIRKAEAR